MRFESKLIDSGDNKVLLVKKDVENLVGSKAKSVKTKNISGGIKIEIQLKGEYSDNRTRETRYIAQRIEGMVNAYNNTPDLDIDVKLADEMGLIEIYIKQK